MKTYKKKGETEQNNKHSKKNAQINKENKQSKQKQPKQIQKQQKGGSFCDAKNDKREIDEMTHGEKCNEMNKILNTQYKCYCGAFGILYPYIKSQTTRDMLYVWWNNFMYSVADQ